MGYQIDGSLSIGVGIGAAGFLFAASVANVEFIEGSSLISREMLLMPRFCKNRSFCAATYSLASLAEERAGRLFDRDSRVSFDS